MWSDNYTRIPYQKDGRSRKGLDCWGLVSLIYQERLGTILPDCAGILKDQSVASLRELARTMKKEQQKWTKVEKPQEYDLVLIRAGMFHVGVVAAKNLMIHIDAGIDSVVEPLNGLQWKNRIEGYYRYAG